MKTLGSAAEAVLTLRRMQHERAEQRFASHLAAEADARTAWTLAETAITEECEAAAALDGDDGVVETFARWLPGARARVMAAAAAHAAASADTALARVALSAAAIALEAAERYEAQAVADRLAARRRAEQSVLDEQAGLRHARP